jgi:cation:H+ antiporter
LTNDLLIAIAIFLGSSAAVIFFGTLLAKYGDALATLTGWGRLFVGSILLALATSLPELSTNISAVQLDPPNPELALGNILGANMINMFTMAMVALVFGGRRFLQRVAPEQGYLILLAAVMTALAVLFAAIRLDVAFWQIGLSSVVLLVVYVIGMRIVYAKRPESEQEEAGEEDPAMTLARASLLFTLVSVGVVIAGIFLAWSVDQIAGITGVASSTLGILVASIVTTMPEATATVAAARMGAADLGVAGLYGSCVFNVTILAYADPFYRQGVLTSQSEPTHFVAGVVAVFLILIGLGLILARNRLPQMVAAGGLALMALIYLAGAVMIGKLGAPDSGRDQGGSQISKPGPEVAIGAGDWPPSNEILIK